MYVYIHMYAQIKEQTLLSKTCIGALITELNKICVLTFTLQQILCISLHNIEYTYFIHNLVTPFEFSPFVH